MKPVYQTKFGGLDDPLESQGNCWQACIASLLHLNIEDVVYIGNQVREWDKCWKATQEFLHGLGFHLLQITWSQHRIPDFPFYAIAVGKSPNIEGKHAVIFHHGRCVHDPVPGGKGLVGDPEYYEILVPLNPGLMLKGD